MNHGNGVVGGRARGFAAAVLGRARPARALRRGSGSGSASIPGRGRRCERVRRRRAAPPDRPATPTSRSSRSPARDARPPPRRTCSRTSLTYGRPGVAGHDAGGPRRARRRLPRPAARALRRARGAAARRRAGGRRGADHRLRRGRLAGVLPGGCSTAPGPTASPSCSTAGGTLRSALAARAHRRPGVLRLRVPRARTRGRGGARRAGRPGRGARRRALRRRAVAQPDLLGERAARLRLGVRASAARTGTRPRSSRTSRVVTGVRGSISFTPVLVPMARGILATCTATAAPGIDDADVRGAYEEAYGGERFVRLLPEGEFPRRRAHDRRQHRCRSGSPSTAPRTRWSSSPRSTTSSRAPPAPRSSRANLALGLPVRV